MVSVDGLAVIDIITFLQVAMDQAGREDYVKNRSWTTASHALRSFFAAQDVPFDGLEYDLPESLTEIGIEGAVAEPTLTAAMAEGARLVLATNEAQSRVDIRHLLVAILLSQAGQKALVDLGLVKGDFTRFFAKLGTALIGHIVENAYEEDTEAWAERAFHFQNVPAPAAPTRRLSHTDYLPDMARQLPSAEDDPLGFGRDARAMAELICLDKAKPPLAVGLFGHWGSGKTTFMRMLEREIDSVTAAARAVVTEAPDKRLPFVGNVVHIWFNAWSYADSEKLWASIATELFRQLSVDGHAGRPQAIKADYLREVREKLAGQRQAAKTLQDERAALERDLDEKEQVLAAIENQRAAASIDRVRTAADSLIRDVVIDNQKVATSLSELGLDAEDLSAAKVVDTAKRLQGVGARWQAVWRALRQGRNRARHWTHLGIYLAVAGLAVFAVSQWADIQLGALMAPVLAGVTPIWKYFEIGAKAIKPLLAEHSQVERALRDKAQAAKDEIVELRANLGAKRAAIAEAQDAAPSLEEAIEEGRSSLLAYFLRERGLIDKWRDHLGVIALVQEAFEELSALFEEQQKAYYAKRDAGQLTDQDKPPIDRIVLYIDDLDRCQHDQVAQVLQAVHLLLAFPLFVVVVGVDARWLSHSLEKVYGDQMRIDGSATAVRPDVADATALEIEKATVSDYLEKIFQVPYWLRGFDDRQGIAYQRLVNNLLGQPENQVEPWIEVEQTPPAAGPTATVAQDDEGETVSTANEDDADSGDPPIIAPVAVEMPPVEETAAETWERVDLIEDEISLMRALGGIAGKSPRAVKRLVNLYRLIRVRKSGEELRALLSGRDENPPLFPAVMLWLAVEIGLDHGDIWLLWQVLSEASGTARLDIFRAPLNSRDPDGDLVAYDSSMAIGGVTYRHFDLLRQFWSTKDVPARQSILWGLRQIDRWNLTIDHLRAAASEVSRYSFRQGLDLGARHD